MQRDIAFNRFAFGMNLKDGKAATDIRFVEHNLAVKTSWPQQGRVKDIRAIGRGDNDNVGLPVKAIHLYKQLIERLFTLVIASGVAIVSLATNGVDFIDENNARRVLFGLFEEVSNTCRTDTNEHLHKFGAAHAKEWDASFTRHST